MIKNVFFDLDGTLVDSEPGIMEGIKLALTTYGYDIPEYATLRKCIGPPFAYSFPNILGVSEEDYPKAVACYREYYDTNGGMFNCRVYDGIEELLKQLVQRGYALNVCSSKPEPTCKKLLSKLGIDKYFSEICGATLDGSIDTKEEVINLCFRRSPWKKKDETILIGDTKFDAKGASDTGLACIGVSWGFGTEDELLDAGAIKVFNTCDEVLEYIELN